MIVYNSYLRTSGLICGYFLLFVSIRVHSRLTWIHRCTGWEPPLAHPMNIWRSRMK